MEMQGFQVKASEFEKANAAFAIKLADDIAMEAQRAADEIARLDGDFADA